jgi:hypothetical protein
MLSPKVKLNGLRQGRIQTEFITRMERFMWFFEETIPMIPFYLLV